MVNENTVHNRSFKIRKLSYTRRMDFNFLSPKKEEAHTETAVYQDSKAATLAVSHYNEEHSKDRYAIIIRWTLRIGVFLIPLLALPWTTSLLEINKQLALVAVAGIGLLSWLLSLVSTGRLAWRGSPFDKGVLAIFGATIIATIFSMSRYNSLFGLPNDVASALLTITACSIIYFLIVNTSENEGLELVDALKLSLTIALAYGLLQIVGVSLLKGLWSAAASRAFNTVGSINALGVVAAASLPFFIRKENSWRSYMNIAASAAALAILVILNWWVLWVVTIAGMVALIMAESVGRGNLSLSKFIAPMTIIVIGSFLMVINLNVVAVKKNLPIEVGPSFNLSFQVAKGALKESLVTGYGPTGFSMAFDKYGANSLANSTLSSTKFFQSTSAFATALVNGGLVMLLALAALAWGLAESIRYYIRHARAIRPEGTAALAVLAALIVAFFLYPFNVSLTFLAFALLGLVSVTLWKGTKRVIDIENNVALSLSSSLGFIGGLIVVLIGVYFSVSNYIADARYAQALVASSRESAAEHMAEAINWNGHSDEYYRQGSQLTLGLLSEELAKKADPTDTERTTRIQNYMVSAINLARRAIEQGPREMMNWDNLGQVYQSLIGLVEGVEALAEESYLKAAELRPGDPAFHNKIGNVYLVRAQLLRQQGGATPNTQQIAEALDRSEKSFQKAIDISNNFGLAIYNLGIVYDAQGKLANAIRQLEKIAPYNANQPNLKFELGLLYYRNGDKDKALGMFENVLVLQPEFSNARWYLSLLYEEKGDISNAIDQLRKILAVEVNKDNETVLTRLHQLEQGKPTQPKGVDQKPL